MADTEPDSAVTGTFNSAHLGRIRAQQRAELRSLMSQK